MEQEVTEIPEDKKGEDFSLNPDAILRVNDTSFLTHWLSVSSVSSCRIISFLDLFTFLA